MTLAELYSAMLQELPELAERSFYDHITIDEGQELYPPFVFVHEVDSEPFNADNRVYWLGTDHRLDVYTADRDPEVRRAIQGFLDSLDIAYSLSFDDFDSDMMLYCDRFTIELD